MGNHGGPARAAMSRRANQPGDITPTGNPGAERFSAYGALDPYAMRDLYGAGQLRAALERLPVDELQRSAATVQARNPGTKPRSRASKAALVDYIMRHVAGEEAPPAREAGAAPKAARPSVADAHAALRDAVRGGDERAILEAAKALVAADRAASRGGGKAGDAEAPGRPGRPGRGRATAMAVNPFADITPIGKVDLTALRPHGPMDPFALHTAYGHAQTRTFLSHLSIAELRRSAAIVTERTGHAPPGRANKGALVDFITGHLPAEPA